MQNGRTRYWGPSVMGDGCTSFRIWAPDANGMTLRLNDEDIAMARDVDGWHEAIVADVAPGARYSFVLPGGQAVPDPAAQAQAGDVHGASLVVDHDLYHWQNDNWRGRPFAEAVIYELHVGTFTEEGTFLAIIDRLPHLAALGVTAIELMPVAQFAGNRGWGYDGVLPYAPHPAYGTPDELKRLVDAAHAHGLMILLDVVYNHFGPEGNYFNAYASIFFDEARQTPWGAAIAYQREPVRRFFIENALYWLDVFRFDGLRLDAIDHVRDPQSEPEVLVALAAEVRRSLPEQHIHLMTEDNRNIVALHPHDEAGQPLLFTAEWNDDFHNVAHVIASGETDGYYRDFAKDRIPMLARILAEGFGYQGETSHVTGEKRGEPSAGQPPTAFIDFLQNHDQIGNRAFGERLLSLAPQPMVEALTVILALSPHVPLLFMGEEWGERRPFCFFTDFEGDLAKAVREGRRREFADFAAFGHDGEALAHIPDPNDLATFEASRIDWNARGSDDGAYWLSFWQRLLALRRREIVPLLKTEWQGGLVQHADETMLVISWRFSEGELSLVANLCDQPRPAPDWPEKPIFTHGEIGNGTIAPYTVSIAWTSS
jgi:maltooligosyltrehalose trehalohydrolase